MSLIFTKRENMIVINFKNYKFGKQSLKLAKKIQRFLLKAIICPPTIDIENISKNTKLRVFAQSADPINNERATGFNTFKAIKKAGAKGTLLNHSEHKISIKEIKKALKICLSLSLKAIVCSSNLKETKKIIPLKPWAIAFEDPKLVGSGSSITKYKSKDVEKFALLLKKTRIIPLCGAGISTADDIKQAKTLGCKGVLIASAITNSKNPSLLLKQISKIR